MKYRGSILILCLVLLLLARLSIERREERMTAGNGANKKNIFVLTDKELEDIKSENEEYAKNKVAYLTFDDGPSKVTGKILDVLKEEDIKATFFILGTEMNEEKIEYLKRMHEEGHTIGIHTYSHNYKEIYQSVEAYVEDFYKVYDFLEDTLGIQIEIFRFPWGSVNQYNKKIRNELIQEMEAKGFRFYDWNVSGEDSTGNPSGATIKKNTLKNLEKYQSPVILLHDSSINENTSLVLSEIIKEIKAKGYRFDTVEKKEPLHFKQQIEN